MKSEESVFTDFNFSFITFSRQVFVNIFDVIKNMNYREYWRFYSLTRKKAGDCDFTSLLSCSADICVYVASIERLTFLN